MSELTSSTGEPPLPFTISPSRRARRVTLRVVPGRGLVVSIPGRFARRDVPAIVEAHRGWAESALAELESRTPEVCRAWPPETLELAAVARRVKVRWRDGGAGGETDGKAVAFAGRARWRDPETLEVAVDRDDRVAVATAVAEVLKAEGRRVLVPRLGTLAERHGLAFSRVAVRGQRSVWGSCAASGTVSLNYKLLFLRPALLDYVLLHELAHTRHLDHSAAFWRLLERLEPDARALDGELREAALRVPPWLETARGRPRAG